MILMKLLSLILCGLCCSKCLYDIWLSHSHLESLGSSSKRLRSSLSASSARWKAFAPLAASRRQSRQSPPAFKHCEHLWTKVWLAQSKVARNSKSSWEPRGFEDVKPTMRFRIGCHQDWRSKLENFGVPWDNEMMKKMNKRIRYKIPLPPRHGPRSGPTAAWRIRPHVPVRRQRASATLGCCSPALSGCCYVCWTLKWVEKDTKTRTLLNP